MKAYNALFDTTEQDHVQQEYERLKRERVKRELKQAFKKTNKEVSADFTFILAITLFVLLFVFVVGSILNR